MAALTLRQIALNLLARREHSRAELYRKLSKKNAAADDIQAILTTLTHEGLLNETRFVENFIHYRRGKGYGPYRIQAELHERGIADNLIEHHLHFTDNAWLDEIKRVWQKRFKGHLPTDPQTRAQQIRFLQYRGFTPEQINRIFRVTHDETDFFHDE